MANKLSVITIACLLAVGFMGSSAAATDPSSLPLSPNESTSSMFSHRQRDPNLTLSLSVSNLESSAPTGDSDSTSFEGISQSNVRYAQKRLTRTYLLKQAGQKLIQYRNQYYLSQIGVVAGYALITIGSSTYPPNTGLATTGALITIGSYIWNLINVNKIGAAGQKLKNAGEAG